MQLLTAELAQESGAYVGLPVKKTIKWNSKGKDHEAFVFVKLKSYETATRQALHTQELDGELNATLVAEIVSCVVNEKNEPVFKLEHIVGDKNGNGKMCASLFIALVMAVREANGLVEEEETKN